MQKPNEFRNKTEYNCFAYLMQFQDLTRIDLRLIKPEFLEDYLDDAFSKVLLDKKNKYLDYNFERSSLYETKQLSEDEINKILNEIYIIILDEITNALDKKSVDEINVFLQNYIQYYPEKIIINISHDINNIRSLKGNYFLIDNQKICKVDTLDDAISWYLGE